jgi:hypothetical protein
VHPITLLARKRVFIVDESKLGICEHCGESFHYEIVHNGFNLSSYAYCDTCGRTALLTQADGRMPVGSCCRMISCDVEPRLRRCECGGHFRANASPRCPHCRKPLSPTYAARYIESNAEGTVKSCWPWVKTWQGLYCMIVEGDRVSDSFK